MRKGQPLDLSDTQFFAAFLRNCGFFILSAGMCRIDDKRIKHPSRWGPQNVWAGYVGDTMGQKGERAARRSRSGELLRRSAEAGGGERDAGMMEGDVIVEVVISTLVLFSLQRTAG